MSKKSKKSIVDSGMEGWEKHWQIVKRIVDIRAAAYAFVTVLIAAAIFLGAYSNQIESYFRSMEAFVEHRDMCYFNTYGNFLLQDYLGEKRAGDTKECAILGASFIASTRESDTNKTINGQLRKRLSEITGDNWRCVTLAASAAVTWCYFYEARLLRKYHKPDVIIVSLDGQDARVRNMHLVLEAGVRNGDLTAKELSFALPYNQQPLYVTEANVKKWLRERFPLFESLNYISYAKPARTALKPWLVHLEALIKGAEPAPIFDATYHTDGVSKSWREVPVNRKRIERLKKTGNRLYWDEKLPAELDLLFGELAKCKEEGIKVIVTVTPLNPEVPQIPGKLGGYISHSAAKHGLKFHNYWQSGLVPADYYYDNGHFFGEGCRIFADELAQTVVVDENTDGEKNNE